jgi:uncharacterized heparinase superfamily protein
VRTVTSIPKSASNHPLFLIETQYVGYLKTAPKVPKKRVRMKSMAASAITGFPIPASTPAAAAARLEPNRRRRITPQAGHALEKLGHAIEYLTDEFVHQGGSFSADNAQLQAVQLLMAMNRKVYFECPEVPTFAERCRFFLRLRAA